MFLLYISSETSVHSGTTFVHSTSSLLVIPFFLNPVNVIILEEAVAGRGMRNTGSEGAGKLARVFWL